MFNKVKAGIMKKVAAAADCVNALAEGIQHRAEHHEEWKEYCKNPNADKFKVVLEDGSTIEKEMQKKYTPTPREEAAFKKARNIFLVSLGVAGATAGGVIGYRRFRSTKEESNNLIEEPWTDDITDSIEVVATEAKEE